ncbi:hypothetical protein PL263_17255 [Methylomonas sp. EFPC3]|uniref:hypothetical protein n=1 Tax=Methylomonas sp. EFPC3 TaxID=3021710 RepID=UPI002417117B|nr:hypothetical protein [Methylomonas sp. EFPC3]WFP49834.1 hypothetical protein PL263_17255 [Methylomonas sp. EFPC3]
MSLLIGLSVVSGLARAELLGSISDDTAPKAQPELAPAGKNDGRRIVYRVICSPEDQDLPDCDRAAVDEPGNGDSAASLPTPDLPPDRDDLAEAAVPTNAEPAAPPLPSETGAHSKKRAHSKSAKKAQAASKKTAAKTRPHR